MTAAPAVTVYAYFTVSGSTSSFVLDDPVRGLLDGATYTLSGDVAIDISASVKVSTITRGRARELDEFQAGVAQLTINNADRLYDSEYAAGTYFGNIKPGKRITIQAGAVTIFDGQVEDWSYDYPLQLNSTANVTVSDCLATLASAEFDAWTTTVGQTPGVRLAAILDRSEVLFPATRALDTGTSTLQADAVSWGSNVLNYCQLVAKCDVGQLFASKDGVLTFYGRNRSVTGVGAPEFRDDGTGIGYAAITRAQGTELLFNRVSVDASGFTKQTVTDSTSFAEFQKFWSLSLSGLPLADATQALDLANYLLNLYKSPTTRFSSITVLLHALSGTDQATVLNLDLGSVVRVVYTPNKVSTAIDKYCRVEGIDHQMFPQYHAVTLRLSNLADGFGGSPFILDDATAGLLDGSYVISF